MPSKKTRQVVRNTISRKRHIHTHKLAVTNDIQEYIRTHISLDQVQYRIHSKDTGLLYVHGYIKDGDVCHPTKPTLYRKCRQCMEYFEVALLAPVTCGMLKDIMYCGWEYSNTMCIHDLNIYVNHMYMCTRAQLLYERSSSLRNQRWCTQSSHTTVTEYRMSIYSYMPEHIPIHRYTHFIRSLHHKSVTRH
jgi:hypothetical protein